MSFKRVLCELIKSSTNSRRRNLCPVLTFITEQIRFEQMGVVCKSDLKFMQRAPTKFSPRSEKNQTREDQEECSTAGEAVWKRDYTQQKQDKQDVSLEPLPTLDPHT